MPKETVYGESLPYGDDDPGRSVAEVSWSRNGSVQLATKCVRADDESDYIPMLEPIEVPVTDPHEFTSVAVSSSLLLEAEGIARNSGFYVDLNRKGINELIRHLRRARDQAFGRDE